MEGDADLYCESRIKDLEKSRESITQSVINSLLVCKMGTFIPASNEPSAVLARAFGECREGQSRYFYLFLD